MTDNCLFCLYFFMSLLYMMIYVPIFVFSVHVIPLVLDSGVCSPYWIKVMTQAVAVIDAWTLSCILE